MGHRGTFTRLAISARAGGFIEFEFKTSFDSSNARLKIYAKHKPTNLTVWMWSSFIEPPVTYHSVDANRRGFLGWLGLKKRIYMQFPPIEYVYVECMDRFEKDCNKLRDVLEKKLASEVIE